MGYIVSYSLLNLMMASELAETYRLINNFTTDNNLCFDFLTLYLYRNWALRSVGCTA